MPPNTPHEPTNQSTTSSSFSAPNSHYLATLQPLPESPSSFGLSTTIPSLNAALAATVNTHHHPPEPPKRDHPPIAFGSSWLLCHVRFLDVSRVLPSYLTLAYPPVTPTKSIPRCLCRVSPTQWIHLSP